MSAKKNLTGGIESEKDDYSAMMKIGFRSL